MANNATHTKTSGSEEGVLTYSRRILPRSISRLLFGWNGRFKSLEHDDHYHKVEQGNTQLEYFFSRAPKETKDRRLLIRLEGRGLHSEDRKKFYAKEVIALNDTEDNVAIDVIVLNNQNLSTTASQAAANIDDFAENIKTLIDTCIEKHGYKMEYITLLGTCVGAQITSHFAAKYKQDYPVKCISDRSFDSFEHVVRGYIKRIRLALEPNSGRPLWQYIPLRILWFPIWIVMESISRLIYAVVRLLLWCSGWDIQQVESINMIPLQRLQVFKAKAYDPTDQLNDDALSYAHVADALEGRRLAVLGHLATLNIKESSKQLLRDARNFIGNRYVYTKEKTRANKPHNPHISPLHELHTHNGLVEHSLLLPHIRNLICASTNDLDQLAKALPSIQNIQYQESIYPILSWCIVAITYGFIHTIIPQYVVKCVGLFYLLDLSYQYTNEPHADSQEKQQTILDIGDEAIRADTIKFAAPWLVNQKPEDQKLFLSSLCLEP